MREKKLLWGVLALGGLYLAVQLVLVMFYRPWSDRSATDERLAGREQRARATIDQAPRHRTEWARLGERTYSSELGGMSLELRKILWPMMEQKAGLGVVNRIPLVKTYEPKSLKASSRLSEVSAELLGKGRLEGVLRAIYSLYRSPRLGNLRRVAIKPARQGTGRGKSGKQTYEFSASYVALWLDQKSPAGTFTVASVEELPASERLAPADWSAYASLASKTMFERWQPPQRPPPARPPARPVSPPPTGPVTPTPPPPPAFGKWSITAIYETDGPDGLEQRATVHDEGQKKTWSVRAGDPLADGEVAAIEPDGSYLVLKVGSRQYVVAMGRGRTFSDRVPLAEYRPIPALVGSGEVTIP